MVISCVLCVTTATCYPQNGGKQKIRRNFSDQIINALGTERFQEVFRSELKLSNYQIVETNFSCWEPRVGMLTGRIISTGEVNTTVLLKAIERWIRTKPTLKIRNDRVVVDHRCPVLYVPSEDYCLSAPPVEQPSSDSPVVSETNNNHTSESTSSGNTLLIVGIVVACSVAVLVVSVMIFCGVLVYRKKRESGRFTR